MYYHRTIVCFWLKINLLSYVLWFGFHSSLSTVIGNKLQPKKNSHMAKHLFCSQNYFDSLSYDGRSYRFTVNRRVIHPDRKQFVYDEFRLYYDGDKHRFHYKFDDSASINRADGNFFLFFIDSL